MRLPQDRILHIDTEFKDGKVNVKVEWQGELVRCKDCRHYGKNEWCEILKAESMLPDGYCAYGERKGGDDE